MYDLDEKGGKLSSFGLNCAYAVVFRIFRSLCRANDKSTNVDIKKATGTSFTAKRRSNVVPRECQRLGTGILHQ